MRKLFDPSIAMGLVQVLLFCLSPVYMTLYAFPTLPRNATEVGQAELLTRHRRACGSSLSVACHSMKIVHLLMMTFKGDSPNFFPVGQNSSWKGPKQGQSC